MSGEGTPFTWPATAESFTLTQSEKLVVDSKERIERVLPFLSEGVWVQEEEQGCDVSGGTLEIRDIDMEGATAPLDLARNLTPAFQAIGNRRGALPLLLWASRHALWVAVAGELGEQSRKEQEEEEEEEIDMDQELEQELLFLIGESCNKNGLIRDIIENWENLEVVMVRGMESARVKKWIDTVT